MERTREVGMSLPTGEELVRMTPPPSAVRDGETFVMVLSVEPMTQDELSEVNESEGHPTLDGTHSSVSAEVASGPVHPCEVRPAAG